MAVLLAPSIAAGYGASFPAIKLPLLLLLVMECMNELWLKPPGVLRRAGHPTGSNSPAWGSCDCAMGNGGWLQWELSAARPASAAAFLVGSPLLPQS